MATTRWAKPRAKSNRKLSENTILRESRSLLTVCQRGGFFDLSYLDGADTVTPGAYADAAENLLTKRDV